MMDDDPGPERFYPDFYPRFENEPTKDRFRIIKTDSSGEGIISRVSFESGEIVFRFAGVLLHDVTLFTLQLTPGSHLHDPFFMGKVLHSCDPNLICDMSSQTFTAARAIRKGQLLTMDYETTEDELFRSFDCRCGSLNCRGHIRGKIFRFPEIHEELPLAAALNA